MIRGFLCIISKCRCTRVKRGRCSFTIGRLLESSQHLLRDHMIARMCILGLGQLGYQRRNERSLCLFTILQQLQTKSTARRDNHNVGDNGNVCDDDKGHRDDSERNLIDGDGDAMHDDGQKAQNKPVYWDSPEAAKLFGFNYDEGCNVYNGLVDRCELLRGVLRRPKGYKSIIQHSDEPQTENQVFQIRNKCVFLLRAYEIALKKMGTTNTPWVKYCCQMAVDQVNGLGLTLQLMQRHSPIGTLIFGRGGNFYTQIHSLQMASNQSLHCLNISQRQQWMRQRLFLIILIILQWRC